MAEPKKRMTSTRSGNRQSHDALKTKPFVICAHCKKAIRPHTVCANCGFYKNKKILALKDEKQKMSEVKEELKDE